MTHKSIFRALALTLMTGLGASSSAFAMSWAEADSKCAAGAGAGCCAAAGDDGMPKMREGYLVCHCGALTQKPGSLTDAMRQGFAKDRANLKEVPAVTGGKKR